MENKTKNVKISEKHHQLLKTHCEKNGLKIYKSIYPYIDFKGIFKVTLAHHTV